MLPSAIVATVCFLLHTWLPLLSTTPFRTPCVILDFERPLLCAMKRKLPDTHILLTDSHSRFWIIIRPWQLQGMRCPLCKWDKRIKQWHSFRYLFQCCSYRPFRFPSLQVKLSNMSSLQQGGSKIISDLLFHSSDSEKATASRVSKAVYCVKASWTSLDRRLAPWKARWIDTMLHVGHSEVAVFLDGVYMTSSAGVLLVNDEGSEARVKDFTVTKKPSMSFYTTSCASLQSVSDGILFSYQQKWCVVSWILPRPSQGHACQRSL